MLNDEQVAAVKRKIADAFLGSIRHLDHAQWGWGQFIGQNTGNQVGLYGTCSGVIAISAAYQNSIPLQAIAYLEGLWASRNDIDSDGPRYFSLTLRLAFYLLALKLSSAPRLLQLVPQVEAELLKRRTADNLFMDWYVSDADNSATGKEYTTAVVILAYTFARNAQPLPEFIRKAALALQSRITGGRNTDLTSRRLYLAAIARALSKLELRRFQRRIRAEYRRRDGATAEYLYFWDYKFRSPSGLEFRRDYFYIPPEVVDVLLASNEVSGTMQKLAALDILEKFWEVIEPSPAGLFFRYGSALAASKDQAWVTLALGCASELMKSDGRVARTRMAIYSGSTNSWAWNFFLPVVLLVVLGMCAGAPGSILGILQHYGYLTPKPTWWDTVASPALITLGAVLLSVIGQSLWVRLWRFAVSRFS